MVPGAPKWHQKVPPVAITGVPQPKFPFQRFERMMRVAERMLQDPHIMRATLPACQNVLELHVEPDNTQYILRELSLAVTPRRRGLSTQGTSYMRPIQGPHAVVEVAGVSSISRDAIRHGKGGRRLLDIIVIEQQKGGEDLVEVSV